MRVLVVLPTYQEAPSVVTVVEALRALDPAVDVLVVDDASPDGTADLVDAGFAGTGGVFVLRRGRKSGLGSAYRDGFRWGLERRYDVLVEMDADGSHDAAVVPALVAAVGGGADLAIGSRYVPGGSIPEWSAWRRALSRWGNRYAIAVLALPATDATSGFRAYRSEVLAAIAFETIAADGYAFQIEGTYRVARSGGTVAEVPIQFVERTQGASKMSSRIIVEALALVSWWGLRDRATGRRAGVSPPSPRGTRPPR